MRSLKIFVAAFEERSFTLAAQREGATQSGVSQHVRNLEERYGVLLFRRDKGKVVPTPAAENFYIHCLNALRANDIAFLRLKQYSGGLSGDVSIGLMPTVSAAALAPALVTFGKRHPNARVHVTEAYSAALMDQVMAGELDLAIVPVMPTTAGVRISNFFSTQETLVMRRGTMAANGLRDRHGLIDLTKLGPVQLILPEVANVRANAIRSFLSSNDVELADVIEMNSMMATLDLIAQSSWCAVLPALMMASRAYADSFDVAIFEPGMTLHLVTVEPAHRGLSPIAEAFTDILRESCTQLMARDHRPT